MAEEVKEVVEEVVEAVEVPQAALEAVAEKMGNLIMANLKANDVPVVKEVAPVVGEKELSKEIKTLDFLKNLAATKAVAVHDSAKTGDGGLGDLIAPADFIADIVKIMTEYGVGRKYVNVYQTKSNAVTINVRTGKVSVSKVSEKGAMGLTNIAVEQISVSLEKYGAIAALTDELDEDAAVSIYKEITESFGEAFAMTEDTIIFTDATSGILANGTAVSMAVGKDSFADVTFDDVKKLKVSVPAAIAKKGVYFGHREILDVLQGLKDLEGRYILGQGVNGGDTYTLWGKPLEIVEVMPDMTDDAPAKAFLAFGDLSYFTLIEKGEIRFKVLDQAVLAVDETTDFNLATQDGSALRAIKRYNGKLTMAAAVAVLKTGATS